MNVSLVDRSRILSSSFRQAIVDRVTSGLNRFDGRIRRICVVLGDENAERGGFDKRCRLSVRLQNWGELIVDELAESFDQAVHRAVDRMDRVLARESQRRAYRRGRVPMGGVPDFA